MSWQLICCFGLGFILTLTGCYGVWDAYLEEKRKDARIVYIAIGLIMAVSGIFFMGLALWKMIQF
ncbi:MAG: hypothetical protein Q7S83_00205 [bacterium]|nr:hypothetical protein [bacterium]